MESSGGGASVEKVSNKFLSQSVSEQKEVTRLMTFLGSSVLGLKSDLTQLLRSFKVYEELWASVRKYEIFSEIPGSFDFIDLL